MKTPCRQPAALFRVQSVFSVPLCEQGQEERIMVKDESTTLMKSLLEKKMDLSIDATQDLGQYDSEVHQSLSQGYFRKRKLKLRRKRLMKKLFRNLK